VARGLHHTTAFLLAIATLPACVEIDPAYGESFTTTTAAGSTTDPTTTDASSGDSTGTLVCDCTAHELCEADTCTPPAKILFVNLDGVTASFGAPDASQDSHNLYPELAGTWEAYGADQATRQTLLTTIEEQWAAYRVVVTDTRPTAGSAPYLMAIVTASPPPEGFASGGAVAFPDCGETIQQDVSFVFVAPGDAFGLQVHADLVSSAFGRGLGLQFTNSNEDIMGYGDQFQETCYARAEMPACTAHHPEFCGGDVNQQSSHLELEALLGAHG
jgi:hypothetical protein